MISTVLKICSFLLFTTTLIVGSYVFYGLYVDLSSLSFSVSSNLDMDTMNVNLVFNVTYSVRETLRDFTLTLIAGNYSETRVVDLRRGSTLLNYTIPLKKVFTSDVYVRFSVNYMNIVKISVVTPKLSITC